MHDGPVDLDDWRSRLADLAAAGVEAHGADPVRAALEDEIERLAGTSPPTLVVERPVLGVDACPAGWVGVLLTPDARPAALTSGSLAALVELARESADLAVVAIDVPIGPEAEVWLRSRPGVEVIEVHPELSFARLAGTPILPPKLDPEGVAARRAALGAVGFEPPMWMRGAGFDEDDLLDACVAAWAAVRHGHGDAD